VLLLAFLLLTAFLLLIASLLILVAYFSRWLYILDYRMRHIILLDYGHRTVIFFCYQTIGILNNYCLGDFNKLLDYRISDQGLNLSNFRISASEKTIGCPPLVKFAFKKERPLVADPLITS
jgi:hypothetical protein